MRKYPINNSGLEFLGLLMEVNFGWVATGIFLALAATVTAGYFLSIGDWKAIFISLPGLAIGIRMHNHGILKFKKEKIEKVVSQSTN